MTLLSPIHLVESFSKRILPKPTVVYDAYWRFAAERQNIYFQRVNLKPPPWTRDPILNTFKFTNVYRASDRVSQYLIKNVIYNGKWSKKDLLFRILLFKTFNKIETWEHLVATFGEISTQTYSFDTYDKLLSKLSAAGNKIYSAAYIMASGRSAFGSNKKHRNHLKLIESIIADDLHEKITEMTSMYQLCKKLLSYPTIGNFLAYQYAIDINYSELTSFSEMDFVIPGPGATDGIKKCFSDPGDFTGEDIIKYVAELQEVEFERRGIKFNTLWGRPLQLIDCQNVFCEIDKYSRVAYPNIGDTSRKRIKQKFAQRSEQIKPWFPPKWGLNEHVAQSFQISANLNKNIG